MQKELSIVLRDKIKDLPFVDLISGVAQVLSEEKPAREGGNLITYRHPVTDSAINGGEDCFGKEISLMPNTSRKSIIYFEDFGISAVTINGHRGFNSSLRLVCWMNRNNLVGGAHVNIAGRAMAMILSRLTGRNPVNVDIFSRLITNTARIIPQDANLFSRYTYNETDRQYLRPPYEFFGIDLSSTFVVDRGCIGVTNWENVICS